MVQELTLSLVQLEGRNEAYQELSSKAANKSGSAKSTNKSGFTNVHLTQSGRYGARDAC